MGMFTEIGKPRALPHVSTCFQKYMEKDTWEDYARQFVDRMTFAQLYFFLTMDDERKEDWLLDRADEWTL